jgi:SAM-dependent methyltransferase
MSFTLEQVVPWGRTFEEYTQMFSLSEADLAGRILGCGDGPASFNAEATERGYQVLSCDPIYDFPAEAIEQRVRETYPVIISQLHQNLDDYVWNTAAAPGFSSPEALGERRMKAMNHFQKDYAQGKSEGRYVTASLPTLPFEDRAFDLALCSHFLFLYSEQLSLEFHIESIRELCRVAREVRIFPLLHLAVKESPYVQPVVSAMQNSGFQVRFVSVPYEFQKGAHTMLCITN